jgi:hypothetical protein
LSRINGINGAIEALEQVKVMISEEIASRSKEAEK